MVEWLKKNILSLVIIGILLYMVMELKNIKDIAEKTENETEMNNFKLDFIDADINKKELDTTTCCDNK